MHLRLLSLALPLALSAPPTFAADAPGDAAVNDADRTRYDYSVRAVGGYFDGMGVRTDSGGIGILELDLTPKLKSGSWSVAIPLQLDRQQTFGADLNETVAGAEIDATRRASDSMSYGPIGGIKYTLRTGWPDLYQPDGTGGLLKTDRFTHLDWYAGWHHWYRLAGKRNLRWKVRVLRQDYRRDANFNEFDPTPTHLVPRDNTRLTFDSSYRVRRGSLHYGVQLDAFYRWDSVAVARVARTGAATTDLQRYWVVEPSAEVGVQLGGLDVALEYGWKKQVDPVTGYYTYAAHHPGVKVDLALGKRFSLQGRAEAWVLGYGPDSTQKTEDQARLYSNRYAAKARARYLVAGDLAVVADVEWAKRDTNYCDYSPVATGTCAASTYDIAWDYTNTMVTAGVEWKP